MAKVKPQTRTTTVVFNEKAQIRAENKETIVGLNELMQMLLEARGYYELWWTYLELKRKPADLIVLRKFKNFFETSAYSYRLSLVVSLYKLYDDRNDVWNIEALIRDAESRTILDANEKQHIHQLLEKAKVIWKKVAVLRSKLFAHRSNKLTREDVYKIAKLTPNEFRDLTNLSLNILNIISSKVCEDLRKFDCFESEDMNKIFDILKLRTYRFLNTSIGRHIPL